jgi:GMP synthase-like glutamine amidotransferase
VVRALAIVHQADAGPGVFVDSIRERGFELEEWNPVDGQPRPDLARFDAAFTFGGAMNVTDGLPSLQEEQRALSELLENDTPLLAVCLGAELLAEAAGASVARCSSPEIGWHMIELADGAAMDPVLGAMPPRIGGFQWHSFGFDLPPGATPLAASEICLQAFRLGTAWGIQFHAEVTLADAQHWIDDYRRDPDAIAIGLDPEALRAETRTRIGAWNDLGRALCDRFLAVAATRA